MGYVNGRRIRRQKLRIIARESSKLAGCTCRPDIRLGTGRAEVRHDEWCPAVDAGRVWAVYRPDLLDGCDR